MSVINGNSPELIVKNGLILNLDAGNRKSYISGSNTWFDLSENNRNGTLTNGPTFDSGNGGSIVFDGIDDYATMAVGSSFGYSPGTTGEVSLEAWVYPTGPFTSYTGDPLHTNLGGIFGQGYFAGTTGWGLGVVVKSDIGSLFVFQTRSDGTIVETGKNSSSTFTTSSWYHIVGTFTRNDFSRLYINGKLATSTSSTSLNGLSITPTTSTANLGRSSAFGPFQFGGRIAAARLYNRPLSASEVLQNYNANKSRFATSSLSISNIPKVPTNGLILSLDAANAKSYVSGSNTIYDLSGNNITGSVFGNPVYSSEGKGNIVFDGTNDYIENAGYTPNANTISVWMKMLGTGNAGLIYVGDDVYDSNQWNWSIFNLSGIYFRGNAGSNGVINFSPSPTGEWIHWTMVRSDRNSRCALYKNGVLYHSDVDSSTTNTYTGFRIGKAGSNYASCSIGLVQMYNRALTDKEIRNLYMTTKDRYNYRAEPYTSYVGTILHLDAGNPSSYTSGSNTWYDLSGLGNHAALLNSPSYSSTEGSGSILFDGINDYATGSYSYYTNTTGNMTAEVWVKIAKFQSDWVRIFGKGNASNRTFGLWAGPASQSLFQRFGPPSNTSYSSDGPSLSLNTWYYMVGVTSGSTQTLYLNGTSVASGVKATSEFWTSMEGYTIGYAGFHTYFTGSISMVKLSNYPLTAAEVSQRYNSTKARYGL